MHFIRTPLPLAHNSSVAIASSFSQHHTSSKSLVWFTSNTKMTFSLTSIMSVNVFLLIYIIQNLQGKKEPLLSSQDSTKLSKGKENVSRNYNYDEDLKKYCIVIEILIFINS